VAVDLEDKLNPRDYRQSTTRGVEHGERPWPVSAKFDATRCAGIPRSVEAQFLAEYGNFGFQLVDSASCVSPLLIKASRPAEHGDSHDADDVENRTSHDQCQFLGSRNAARSSSRISAGMGMSGNHPPYQVPMARGDTVDVINQSEQLSFGTRPNLSIVPTTAVVGGDADVRRNVGESRWVGTPDHRLTRVERTWSARETNVGELTRAGDAAGISRGRRYLARGHTMPNRCAAWTSSTIEGISKDLVDVAASTSPEGNSPSPTPP